MVFRQDHTKGEPSPIEHDPRALKLHGMLQRFGGHFRFREGGRWIVLATVLGTGIGLAAAVFQRALDMARNLLFLQPEAALNSAVPGTQSRHAARILFLLVVPAIGGAASAWLTSRFAPEATGHGTDALVRAYHRAGGRIRFRVAPLKLLASMLTLGTGGSAGREGPVAQFGGALGSSVARMLNLDPRACRILLLSGAAGGIGAIFRAPLGGALFAAEVVYRGPDFEGSAVFPGVITAIVSYSAFSILMGTESLFRTSELVFSRPVELPFYGLLGLLCAALGILYVRTFYRGERMFRSIFGPPPMRAAAGGCALGMLSILCSWAGGSDDLLLGGGYELAQRAMDVGIGPVSLFVLALGKIAATTCTISSGGSGGVFAPSLAIGACLGSSFGQAGHAILPTFAPDPTACALVGMGGFFAGVAKTPLTSVILICEMTGSYGLLIPLILVASVSSLLAPHTSIYREQVQSRKESPAHLGELAAAALASLKIADAIDRRVSPPTVDHATPLVQVAKRAAEEGIGSFAVVDDEGRLCGLLTLPDLHQAGRETIATFLIARDLVRAVPRVLPDLDLRAALGLLVARDQEDLLVVDPENPGRPLAILSRQDLLRTYEKLAGRLSE